MPVHSLMLIHDVNHFAFLQEEKRANKLGGCFVEYNEKTGRKKEKITRVDEEKLDRKVSAVNWCLQRKCKKRPMKRGRFKPLVHELSQKPTGSMAYSVSCAVLTQAA